MDEDFLERINWVNFRTQVNLGLPCAKCGNPDTEMHHINHVRKGKISLINPKDSVTKMMFLRNRNQVPLCRACHDQVHAGVYDGPPIRKLLFSSGNIFKYAGEGLPGKNYDNRIINPEGFIKKDSTDPPPPLTLEGSLISKGWKLNN